MIVPPPNVARCSEAPADAPLLQEFPSAASAERSILASASRNLRVQSLAHLRDITLEKYGECPEPEMFRAAEHPADPVVQTNYRVDSMTTGSECG